MCSAEDLTPAQREALVLDEAATRAARSSSAFDLALGVTLDRLFRGDRLMQVGTSRESDYARERLGVSPSLMYSWVALARGLERRPLLRQAVSVGAVSTRKALAVMLLAVGNEEAAWTEAAMRLTLREIASAVRAAGKEAPGERFEAEAIVLPMTPEQQARLDLGLAFAMDTIGPEAKRWQCLEAMCEEWLSDHGERMGARGKEDHGPLAPLRGKILMKQLAAIGEALDVIREIGKEPLKDNALGLDARARRLVAARRRYDLVFGALAERVRDECVPEILGYGTFERYCDERLGVSAGTVRQRIWLERRMREMPALRDAVSSGRLTYSKAVLVAKHATPADVDDRIARAAATTCQQTERETEAEEDRRNRGAGVRNLWAPSDAARTVWDAIGSAQAWSLGERGMEIDAGEALALIADHFVRIYETHLVKSEGGRRMEKLRREILMRKWGLCAAPGCTREARHIHHVVFRSRGGPDEAWNGVGLCVPHHLHGIHLGYLELTGRAGERLHWRFGASEAIPLEEWVTLGDDDVRRADQVPRDPAYGFDGAGVVGEGVTVAWPASDGNVESGADRADGAAAMAVNDNEGIAA
ncbi:MAG: HNH endonuclease [Planctomycetota bacterium]